MSDQPIKMPTPPRSVWDIMMEIVPQDVEIDDPHTADAARVNEMHKALYGRDSDNWEEPSATD